MRAYLSVIGGGLAGCEAAWAAANMGIDVALYEMRPEVPTPAHNTDKLAELVCSNSLKSSKITTAAGILKAEMNLLGSLLLACAEKCAVAAGDALAVDRSLFADLVTEKVINHPGIKLVRKEVMELEELEPVVVAAGPLASEALCQALSRLFKKVRPKTFGRAPFLSFYDAVSPIVAADSLDESQLFRASRYRQEMGDYLNCPLDPGQYKELVSDLKSAEVQPLRPFERATYFEGCLPIEEMARRGEDAMRFGPLKPVGLKDPRTGKRPYAVVQLRVENKEGTMYNMVGFQTRMKWGEQKRIFRKLPGLANAELLRYGQVHRNTFINSPLLIAPPLQLRGQPGFFIGGQLVGVEGYMESAATGILAGLNAARLILGRPLAVPPPETCLGSLIKYITQASAANFQPMNANLGLLPPLSPPVKNRLSRKEKLAERALTELKMWQEKELR